MRPTPIKPPQVASLDAKTQLQTHTTVEFAAQLQVQLGTTAWAQAPLSIIGVALIYDAKAQAAILREIKSGPRRWPQRRQTQGKDESLQNDCLLHLA